MIKVGNTLGSARIVMNHEVKENKLEKEYACAPGRDYSSNLYLEST